MRLTAALFLCLSLAFADSFSSMSYRHSDNQQRSPDGTISSGGLQRYAFQHFSTFSLGSHFVFAEMSSADFESESKDYSFVAWSPSFSLSQLSDKNISWGLIGDTSLSLGLERAYDYKAELAGLALSLDVPTFNYMTLKLLYRQDNINSDNYHFSLAWDKNFILGLPWRFSGFAMYYGTDSGTSFFAEPQLMIEGKVFGAEYKELSFGLSLYILNETKALDQHIPTLVLKWSW